MPDLAAHRYRSDALLKLAMETADLGERSRLMGEAAHWSRLACDLGEAPSITPLEDLLDPEEA